jgi:outer membrane protein assembly factor BamB
MMPIARFSRIESAALWIIAVACGGDAVTPPEGSGNPGPVVSSIQVVPSVRTIGILGIPVGVRALALNEKGEILYGSYQDPGRFSWSSSAPAVATIDGGPPLIKGVSDGTATITASSQGVTGTVTVTVRDHARIAWSVPVGTGSLSSGLAIGADGTIYVGADDFAANLSRWSAMSPQGAVRWTADLPLTARSTPAIGADGTLYLGSRSTSAGNFAGRLIAVDPRGSVRWMLEEIDGIRSSPATGPDGTIYAAGFRHVYAVDPRGQIRWSYETPVNVFFLSSPAVASDGTIYVGGEDTFLYAIKSDGALRWTFKTNGRIRSSPSVGADGTIYFGSMDGRLYAVRPDGTERWSVLLDDRGVNSSPSVGPDGTIYVGGAGGVFAIDPGGSVRWNYGGPSAPVETTPILGADGTVYIGAHFGIVALDARGNLLWDFGSGNRGGGSPAIGADGTIVWTSFSQESYEGSLHAIRETRSMNGGFAGAPWPQERGGHANDGRGGR